MSLAEQALSYVRAISAYQPGKPITELAREMGLPVESIVKLASNENPLGMSPKARKAVEAAIGGIERYPDQFDLIKAVAGATGVEQVVGNAEPLGCPQIRWRPVVTHCSVHAPQVFAVGDCCPARGRQAAERVGRHQFENWHVPARFQGHADLR